MKLVGFISEFWIFSLLYPSYLECWYCTYAFFRRLSIVDVSDRKNDFEHPKTRTGYYNDNILRKRLQGLDLLFLIRLYVAQLYYDDVPNSLYCSLSHSWEDHRLLTWEIGVSMPITKNPKSLIRCRNSSYSF